MMLERCKHSGGKNKGRFNTLVRIYGYRCQGCHTVPVFLSADHILGKIPFINRNTFSNLQLLCRECHKLKDNQRNDVVLP